MEKAIITNKSNYELDELIRRTRLENEAYYVINEYKKTFNGSLNKISDLNFSIKDATDEEINMFIQKLERIANAQQLVRRINNVSDGKAEYESTAVPTTVSVSSLLHFGIKGMKWGQRRARSKMEKNQREMIERQKKEAARKAKIMKSPSKLYKHRDEFTKKEIDDAISKMKMERELRSLSRDKISNGADFAKSFLKYAETANSVYNLYQSPGGQVLVKKVNKAAKR